MFFIDSSRLVAISILLGVAVPAAAAGGSAALSGSPALALDASETNCLLRNKAQTGFQSYQLLLGRRSRIPFELDVDIIIDEEPIELGFSYRLPDQSYSPIYGRGKAEWLAEAAFAAQEISDDEYFRRLDEAELMDDTPNPALSNAIITVDGLEWADYVKERRSAERFPKLREGSVIVRYDGVSVVAVEGEEEIRTLSVDYDGPCKIVLEVE